MPRGRFSCRPEIPQLAVLRRRQQTLPALRPVITGARRFKLSRGAARCRARFRRRRARSRERDMTAPAEAQPRRRVFTPSRDCAGSRRRKRALTPGRPTPPPPSLAPLLLTPEESELRLFLFGQPRGASAGSSIAPSCSTSARCSAVSFFGTATVSRTARSPTPRPCTLGMPRPRSTLIVPGCVPAATSSSIGSSSVGTVTRAPSAACANVSGTSVYRSSPSRSKLSVALDAKRDVEVPGRPALRARHALAGHAQRLALVDARRHVDDDRLLLRSTPPPLHSTHLSFTMRPRPRHVGQVVAIMKMPCECATWPRPPQVPHAAGCEPGLPPEPPHSSQCTSRVSSSGF